MKKARVILFLTVGLLSLMLLGCHRKDTAVRQACEAILNGENPSIWVDTFKMHADELERYRNYLPVESAIVDGSKSSVAGYLAGIYERWEEWDSAVFFAKIALHKGSEPLALHVMIDAATATKNKEALDTLRNVDVGKFDDLMRIDYDIALANYADALRKLREFGDRAASTADILFRMTIEERYIKVAEKEGDSHAIRKIVNNIWDHAFTTDENFQRFLETLRNRKANKRQLETAILVRDAFVSLYDVEKKGGSQQETAIWRERARLLSEGIMMDEVLERKRTLKLVWPKLGYQE